MGVDYGEIKKLESAVENINNTKDKLISKIAKELAARLLRDVVKRTPVGKTQETELLVWRKGKDGTARVAKNKDGTAKTKLSKTYTGGTLRRGWTVDNNVTMLIGAYTIKVYNNIFYCTYVENGHRQTPGRYVPAIGKRLKRSWVPGKHMLRISAEELQKRAQGIVEKRVKDWLNEVMR